MLFLNKYLGGTNAIIKKKLAKEENITLTVDYLH